MPSTFTPFPRLPTELRLKIWKHAVQDTYELHERRVIRIDHNDTLAAPISREMIQEDVPGLIGACHESREVALTGYCALFDYNNPNWILAGNLGVNRYQEIMSILQLPAVPWSRPGYHSFVLQSAILTNMNEHRTDRDQDSLFSTFGEKDLPIGPRWFSSDHDIVLLTLFRPHNLSPAWDFGLWSHNNPEAQKIKHLAFELGTLDFDEKEKLWLWHSEVSPMRATKDHLDAIESVTFLCMEIYEVIIVTLDDHLEYDKWTYSLDIESKAFDAQMRDRWANVTWNVKLSRPPADKYYRHDLWGAIATWNPKVDVWYSQKLQLCEKESSVSPKWFTQRPASLDETWHHLLKPSPDGNSYIGP